MFEPKAGSGGLSFRARKRSGSVAAKGKTPPGQAVGDFTDEEAEVLDRETLAAIEVGSVEPAVRERARAIARALSLPRPRPLGQRRRGRGRLVSMPYRGSSDELDLDATLEALAAKPVPEDEDVVVRERVRTSRAVVLLVDISGSSKGERLVTSAATVAALAAELTRDELAVIAFWSDAAILLEMGGPIRPLELLDQLTRLNAQGLTNVAFPLQLAAEQLTRAHEGGRDARVILLSDCVHNAGPDPRPLAARLPRLDVLLDISGERDVDLGRELALAGHGTLNLVRTAHDVAPAITAMFRDR